MLVHVYDRSFYKNNKSSNVAKDNEPAYFDQFIDLQIEHNFENRYVDKVMTFSCTLDEFNRVGFECEGYIETQTDRFVIKEIEEDSTTDLAFITATLDFEEWENGIVINAYKTSGSALKSIDAAEAVEMINNATYYGSSNYADTGSAISGTGWTFTFDRDIDKSVVYSKKVFAINGVTAIEALKQLLVHYDFEARFNTLKKEVYLASSKHPIGSTYGKAYYEQFSIASFKRHRSSYDTYNFVCAMPNVWGEGASKSEWDKSLYGSIASGNLYYHDTSFMKKRKGFLYVRNADSENRSEISQARFNALCSNAMYNAKKSFKYRVNPEESFTCKLIDFNEQLGHVEANKIKIGDRVELIYPKFKERATLRVTHIIEYPLAPEMTEITWSNMLKSYKENVSEGMSGTISTTGVKAGVTLSFANIVYASGYLTGGGTSFRFTIPCPELARNVNSIKVKSGGIVVRQGGKYLGTYSDSSAANLVSTSIFTSVSLSYSNQTLSFVVDCKSAWANAINNDVIAVRISDLSVTLA